MNSAGADIPVLEVQRLKNSGGTGGKNRKGNPNGFQIVSISDPNTLLQQDRLKGLNGWPAYRRKENEKKASLSRLRRRVSRIVLTRASCGKPEIQSETKQSITSLITDRSMNVYPDQDWIGDVSRRVKI